MIVQQTWVFLFLSYWLFCLVLFKIRTANNHVLKYLDSLGRKFFTLVLALYIFSWLFCVVETSVEEGHHLLAITLHLLTILFDLAGTVLLVWYAFKGGGLVLVFPLLLLRYGSKGAEQYVEGIIKKKRGTN